MDDIPVFRQANPEITENYDGHFPVLGSATNNIKSSGEQEKVQSFKGKITRSISRQVNLQNIIQGQKRKQTLDTQQGRKHDAGKKKEMMKETMETSCQEKEDKKTYLKQTSVGGTGKLNDEEDCSLSLEQLRLIKASNRTNPQTRRYRKLMRLKKIEEESLEEKEKRNAKEREAKAKERAKETIEEKEKRNAKEQEAKAKERAKETIEQKERTNAKEQEAKAKESVKETLEQKEKRNAKER